MNGLKYVMTSCITSIHGNSMQILKKLSERFDQMIRDYAYSWFKKKFKDRNETRTIRTGIDLLSSDLIKKRRILSTNATIHTFLPTVVATSLWLTKLVLGLKSNSRIGLFFNETNHTSITASRFLIDEAGNFIEYDLVLEKIKRDLIFILDYLDDTDKKSDIDVLNKRAINAQMLVFYRFVDSLLQAFTNAPRKN